MILLTEFGAKTNVTGILLLLFVFKFLFIILKIIIYVYIYIFFFGGVGGGGGGEWQLASHYRYLQELYGVRLNE